MKLTSPARPMHRVLSLASFLTVFLFITSPFVVHSADEHSLIDGYSHAEIKRGERFFKGLLPFNFKGQSCVSCHNLVPTDTLNWNPSAYAIAVKYAGRDFESFKMSIDEPEGNVLAKVHAGINIGEEDLKTVKAYLDNMAMTGPRPVKPSINSLLLFLFFGILITWALLELIFFRKIKYRFVPVLVLLGSLGYQGKVVYEEGVKLGRSPGYAPEQPIKFSHQIHVAQNKIDCMYCHYTVEESKSAGIPPADLCMNCHSLVREGSRSGKFEIAKVIQANEDQKPIEWIKVHDLPDHVFFSHAQHVKAGKLDCKECHGNIEEMHEVRQVEDLSMGWCLSCHRTKEVQFADNNFYKNYERLHEQIRNGEIEKVTVDMIGGESCMKCHY